MSTYRDILVAQNNLNNCTNNLNRLSMARDKSAMQFNTGHAVNGVPFVEMPDWIFDATVTLLEQHYRKQLETIKEALKTACREFSLEGDTDANQ